MGLSLSYLMSNSHSIWIKDVGESNIWYWFSHFQQASETGFNLRLVDCTHKKMYGILELNNFECLKMLNGLDLFFFVSSKGQTQMYWKCLGWLDLV